MRCFFFHEWSKWESYRVVEVEVKIIGGKKYLSMADKQKRICERCGKMETKEV